MLVSRMREEIKGQRSIERLGEVVRDALGMEWDGFWLKLSYENAMLMLMSWYQYARHAEGFPSQILIFDLFA